MERTNGANSKPLLRLRQIRHVHLIGICGTGMSALAGLFLSSGVKVTGSDQAAYPPTSVLLDAMGLTVKIGYHPENLVPRPDLVVVGNVVRKDNPEALEMERLGLPYASLPECLNKFFLPDKMPIVVAGTHGKTTVSSMVAWILIKAGLTPGFLIGGIHGNLGVNYHIGSGRYFVLEGDEYDTAYFDKRPKLLHYHPYISVVTSCEFDHADIYRDVSQIEDQFKKFAGQTSSEGALLVCAEYQKIASILNCSGRRVTYGLNGGCTWTLGDVRHHKEGMELSVARDRTVVVKGEVPFMGLHNALNALAALAVADLVGISPQTSLGALATYKMTARRQQVLLSNPTVTVIDDFAHHPTAVGETLKAVRLHWKPKRLIAVFEPRSNSSRMAVFQGAYADSLSNADLAIIKDPDFRSTDPLDNRFSADRLVSTLTARGISAASFSKSDAIIDFLVNNVAANDVILVMSNGHFDCLAQRLVQIFQEENVERSTALPKD